MGTATTKPGWSLYQTVTAGARWPRVTADEGPNKSSTAALWIIGGAALVAGALGAHAGARLGDKRWYRLLRSSALAYVGWVTLARVLKSDAVAKSLESPRWLLR